jgi:hypothetical protein
VFSYSCLQAPEKVGLGVLDLANTTASSGAEVPIPILMDVSNTAPSQRNGQGPVDSPEVSQKAPAPIISITKPPAPLPVDLPTHDDIVPPALDFDSHPDDIESSGSLMREVSHHSRTTVEFSNPGSQRGSPSDPSSTQTSLSGYATPLQSVPSTSLSRIADLLGDSAPPIQPPPSARPSPRATSPPLLLPSESTPINADESDQEGEELAATIRLVGKGGEVGFALDQAPSEEAGNARSQAETSSTAFSSKEPPSPLEGDSHGKTSLVRDLREGQSRN